jgi:hypothetical protein
MGRLVPWPNDRLDKVAFAIARRLPTRLVYWCAIRVGVHATTGQYKEQNVPELRFMDAIDRWERDQPRMRR